ncbi:MAG: choice-of-anchor D domain-containing protein [Solirubrobacterales bacterium]
MVASPASAATAKKGTGRLVPSDVTVSTRIDNGTIADIGFRVTNRSEHAQRSRRAQLSLVDDSQKSRRLGNVTIPRLDGGGFIDETGSRRVRNATPAGTYRAQVCVRSQVRLRCATSNQEVVITPAELEADPSPVDFGSVILGEASAPVDVQITNTGGVASAVPSLSFTGTNAADFTVVGGDCDDSDLSPGDSCTATLRFTPGGAGSRSASLQVTGGSSTLAVPLQGTALKQASISIAPPSHGFGGQEIDTFSPRQTFTVTNDGDVPTSALNTALVGPDQGQFRIDADLNGCVGKTLAAGQSCPIDVRFAPTAAGSKVSSLQVQASTGGTTAASLSGTGLKPAELQITPTSKDFGKVQLGSVSSSTTFTVENVGESPSSALNTTTTDSQFGIPLPNDDCSTVVLDPGQTCTVDANFEPSAHGDQSGDLEVSATKGGTAKASLSGYGGDPAKLEISPASYDFEEVQVDTDSAPKTFTVTNTGDFQAVPISSVGVDGAGFSIKSDTCAFAAVEPGGTCTIDVGFKPASRGDKTGTVTVLSTSSGTPSASLSGFGADPAKIVLTPDTYDFGNVVAGGSFTKNFTATNSGDLPAQGFVMVVSGSSDYYIELGDCSPSGLAAGASCHPTIRFSPTSTGIQAATVKMLDSAQGLPSGVPTEVTGNGVATDAQLVFDPTFRLFNPLLGGGTFSTPVYITNTGAADAHGLTFTAGSTNTANVDTAFTSFQGGIPNGSPHPPCGTDLAGGSTCGGFFIWRAGEALNPTQASIKVTGLPGGTSEFTATFGGP